MSKISVIIPVYNAGNKLIKCVNSVLRQSFTDIEVLIVNDGSTDNSINICKSFAEKDNRIVLIDSIKNEGLIAARKKGIEAASSEFLMFVDADDWVSDNIAEALFSNTNEIIDVVVCNIYKVVDRFSLVKSIKFNEYLKGNRLFDRKDIVNILLPSYMYGGSFSASMFAKLYRKSLFEDIDFNLNGIRFFGEDLYLNVQILTKSRNIQMLDKGLYYYKVGGGTSKYMPYFFDDVIKGYAIQKKVIDTYLLSEKENMINGISIMLLNCFKTGITNLFFSSLSYKGRVSKIQESIRSSEVKECINNDGCVEYFDRNFINAIKRQDLRQLYWLGKKNYLKGLPKRALMKLVSTL